MDLLVQTGFRRAVVSLTLDDVQKVSSALIDFHCMLKVKAAMDQFKNGLKTRSVAYVGRKPISLETIVC